MSAGKRNGNARGGRRIESEEVAEPIGKDFAVGAPPRSLLGSEFANTVEG